MKKRPPSPGKTGESPPAASNPGVVPDSADRGEGVAETADGPSPVPEAWVERLDALVGSERRNQMLRDLEHPLPLTFRWNETRWDLERTLEDLGKAGLRPEPCPGFPRAFRLPRTSLRDLQGTEAHREGAVYVQGLTSMMAPLALDAQPGERVLDLCAAPGSKTGQIADRMGGRGRLLANDRSRTRCFRLRSVLDQQGAEWVEVSHGKGESMGRRSPESFDRVLLDAPCSGEGRFRIGDPASFSDWKPSKIKRLAGEQQALFTSAFKALVPGGVLVYSTCTLAPEENERLVSRMLKRFGESLEVEPIEWSGSDALGCLGEPGITEWRDRPMDPRVSRTRRVWPSSETEGFYLARFRKI